MKDMLKLAVLIDADNPSAAIAKDLLAEVATLGTATVKRAYGDWTTTNLTGWKDKLHEMAIQPIQQFRYTTGKNSTDSALIIDAMDLLHSRQLDGFCLVSSDSDFTRLATRIREAGLVVYGFGARHTPQPFVAACDKFIYTEILTPAAASTVAPAKGALPRVAALGKDAEKMLRQAISAAARDDGYALLSSVGHIILQNNSSFDARTYGFSKLGELMRHLPFIEVKEVTNEKALTVQLLVKIKAKKTA